MQENCEDCHYFINFGLRGFCMLARQVIIDYDLANFIRCDFRRIENVLHDHDAVERSIKENDQSLPDQE